MQSDKESDKEMHVFVRNFQIQLKQNMYRPDDHFADEL